MLQRSLQQNLALFDHVIPTETIGSQLPIRVYRIGNEERAIATGEYLLERGHYASVVFFPTVPRGEAALRMAVTAAHDPDDIRELSALLRAAESEETVETNGVDIAGAGEAARAFV